MSVNGVGLRLEVKVLLVAVYFHKWPRLHRHLRDHWRRRRGGRRNPIRRQTRVGNASPEK